MRRAFGPAMVFVAAVVLGGFELGLGCSHEPKPAVVEPAGPPPLPPASGTPIGYLVDDAGELKLTDDQLAKLKVIDEELAPKLATFDSQLHSPGAGAGSGQSRGRRRGGGGGGGGFSGGGGFRGGGRRGGAGSGSGSAVQPRPGGGASADTVNRSRRRRRDRWSTPGYRTGDAVSFRSQARHSAYKRGLTTLLPEWTIGLPLGFLIQISTWARFDPRSGMEC